MPDLLLLDALDRLARDLVEQERALRRLEFDGIRIVANDYDSEHGGRELTRAVKGADRDPTEYPQAVPGS